MTADKIDMIADWVILIGLVIVALYNTVRLVTAYVDGVVTERMGRRLNSPARTYTRLDSPTSYWSALFWRLVYMVISWLFAFVMFIQILSPGA
ncbi:MAG: hypothetical protein GX221_02120 [Candidatus Riflebacteria bacterium]|nr:hypothetical protein [Candidatus Riflebacteria bacterium]